MIDNLLGGNDDEPESEVDDEGEGLFDEEDGGLGGDDLMGDDLMGGDGDDALDGDGLDGEGLDDGLGGAAGGGGGGPSNAEIENRMDELDNEVDSVASSVETVKRENEQISDSIGDVEENVRKLLEIYEMVTKGVNPFVDGSELGEGFGGAAGGDASMGLFDDAEEKVDDEVDDEVANADAEEFFDEDIDEFEDDVADETDDEVDDEVLDEFADDEVDEDDGDDGDDGGGRTFEELKAEYEAADEDVWDDDETARDEMDGEDSAVDDLSATGTEPDSSNASHDEQASGSDGDSADSDGGKPYLEHLPSGYVSDMVVMDWLEFLVDETGVDGASRTVAYYEAIGWLGEPAAERLQTFLAGFGDGVESDPEPRSSLTVTHHDTSLRYIGRIANPSVDVVAFDDHLGRRVGTPPEVGGGIADRYPVLSTRDDGDSPLVAMESDGGHRLTDVRAGVGSEREAPGTDAVADTGVETSGSDAVTQADVGTVEEPLYRGGSRGEAESTREDVESAEDVFIWGEDRR